MSDFDTYGRYGTSDQGSPAPAGAPAAGLGYASPMYIARVTQAAGSGTSLDISIPVPVKGRVVDAYALVTTGVASSVVQLFTAASGGGTAASSAISTASAGKIRDNLTTASQVFAKDSTIFAHVSGGATLAAFELHVVICPEQ
jgi:hypothetical protein